MRAAGAAETYVAWAVFAATFICGAATVLQTVRLGRIGMGHVLMMGSSGAFIAVCISAVAEGGPALLATLVIAAALFQLVHVRPALVVPAGADAHRLGDRDHADTGDGHAGHLRHAGGRAGREPGGRGAAERPGHGAGGRRPRAEGDGGVAAVGAGSRRRVRRRGRGAFRDLRHGPRCGGAVDRAARGPVAGLGPRLRAGILGAPPGLPAGGGDRLHPHHQQLHRGPAHVVAPPPGRGFPGGAGRGDRGRARQPCLRPRRHGAEHRLHHRGVGGRADRRRRPEPRGGRGGDSWWRWPSFPRLSRWWWRYRPR